jgi:hypothetical protein
MSSLFISECSCPSQQTTIEGMIGPNEETGQAKWKVPVPTCQAQLVSPASAPDVETRRFSKGEHLVQYVYKHGSGRLTCDVNIKMEGEFRATFCLWQQISGILVEFFILFSL